jgi:TetR/AcrR family transcriptional regulator
MGYVEMLQRIRRSRSAPSDTAAYKRFLSAGRKISARKGCSGTSVREIVEVAGVTKPVLYYYFRHKEGFYLELFRELFAKLVALLDEVSSGRGRATKWGEAILLTSTLSVL